MRDADLLVPRPSLVHPGLLARAVERIGEDATSPADLWRRLTETYAVDLDAVAALLPSAEPDPIWLASRV